jgi:hypothetical protein
MKDLKKKMEQVLKYLVPATTITYTAKPERPGPKKSKGRTPNYKIPATPKNSGIGWGP